MSDNLGDFTIGLDVSDFTRSMSRASDSADDLKSSLDKTKNVLEYLEKQQEDTAEAFQKELSSEYEDLQSKIDDTKARLEELQAQQEDFSAEDIDSSEYDTLTAQIDETNAELEELQAQSDAVSGQISDLNATADALGVSFEKVGDDASDASKKIGDADGASNDLGDAFSGLSSKAGMLGGAIGGLVGGSISGLMDIAVQAAEKVVEMAMAFDQANSILVEKTGASSEALAEFNEIAKDTAIALDGLDVTGTASVVGELNTRLDLTGVELQRATMLIGQFADITGTDAEQAVVSINDVMKNWNMSTDEMQSLLDKLTVAGQKSGISVEELTTSLSKNKYIFDEMGLSIDESIGLLANFEKNGIESTTAMTGFRLAIGKWSKEGKSAEKGFADLSKQIANTTTQQEANNLAIEYFGTRTGPYLANAIKNGRFEFDYMTEAIKASEGALADTEARSDTMADKAEQLGDAIGIVAFGGDSLGDTFEKVSGQADMMGVSVGDAILQYLGLQEAQQGVLDKSPELADAETQETERLRKQAEIEQLASGGYETMSNNMDSIGEKIQTLNEQYEENYDTAYKNIDGSIGLFEDMTIKSGKSVDSMIGSLKSQVKYMDNYASNMKRAVELGVDQGLINKLSDGSKESAELLQSIVDDGGEHISELNEEFKKVEEGKKTFSDTYAKMATEFDKNMAQIETRLGLAVDSMDQYKEAYDNGSDTVKGFIKGSSAHYTEIYNAYKKVAEQANRAVKTTLQIKSPSRVMMQLGEYTTEGFAEGALKEIDSVQNAFSKIAKVPMDMPTANISNIGGSNTINVNVPIQVSRQMTDSDITRKADMITNIVSRKFAEATGGSLS